MSVRTTEFVSVTSAGVDPPDPATSRAVGVGSMRASPVGEPPRVALGVGRPGDDEDPFAAVGGFNVGRGENPVAAHVPDRGQSLNDSGHSVAVVCSEQPRDVLEHAQSGVWVKVAESTCDVIEEPSFVGGSGASPGHGYRLAGEAGRENVDGLR